MSQLSFDFRVHADHPCLAGHFPGQPIVPGVLLLDHVMQGLSAGAGREVIRVLRVKFTSVLSPGESARADCVLDGDRASFRVSTQRGAERVLLADGVGVLAQGGPR